MFHFDCSNSGVTCIGKRERARLSDADRVLGLRTRIFGLRECGVAASRTKYPLANSACPGTALVVPEARSSKCHTVEPSGYPGRCARQQCARPWLSRFG